MVAVLGRDPEGVGSALLAVVEGQLLAESVRVELANCQGKGKMVGCVGLSKLNVGAYLHRGLPQSLSSCGKHCNNVSSSLVWVRSTCEPLVPDVCVCEGECVCVCV